MSEFRLIYLILSKFCNVLLHNRMKSGFIREWKGSVRSHISAPLEHRSSTWGRQLLIPFHLRSILEKLFLHSVRTCKNNTKNCYGLYIVHWFFIGFPPLENSLPRRTFYLKFSGLRWIISETSWGRFSSAWLYIIRGSLCQEMIDTTYVWIKYLTN